MKYSRNDKIFMFEAVDLARQAWGKTSPNPMVGAVIVSNDRIVGRGFHHQAGQPHAEVNALADAKEKAAGATMYVTLEPCSTTGRTPPCTEAIIKAGIKRVFIGSNDPNPAHCGRGVDILQNAGIEVFTGLEANICDELNEAFFKWITTGKPFVLLKMAMTLDGKIATADGCSKWITGPSARSRVQELRQWADAIMVGGTTAKADTPSLTVRNVENWQPQPERIIVSSTISREEIDAMLPPGGPVEVIAPRNAEEWNAYLLKLGQKNITAVLVEGGGELAAEILSAGIIDKVEFHIAPKILGGRDSRPVVGGANPLTLAEALQLSKVYVGKIGDDITVSGYINNKKKSD